MAILLDHVLVPSRSPVASAEVFAGILGVAWEAKVGHFTPVYVNETLTLDFDEAERFESHHYCFHVSDEVYSRAFVMRGSQVRVLQAAPFFSTG